MISSSLRDIFVDVKQIPLIEVLEKYSPNPIIKKYNRYMMLCPFHGDRHPSLMIKEDKWRCWPCNTHGDSIDFVGKLYGLNPLESAKLIARDFGVPMDNKPLSKKQIKTIQQKNKLREISKEFEEYVDINYQNLCDARILTYAVLDKTKFSHMPDMLDVYLDILQFGSDRQRLDFLKSGVVQCWMKLLPKTS